MHNGHRWTAPTAQSPKTIDYFRSGPFPQLLPGSRSGRIFPASARQIRPGRPGGRGGSPTLGATAREPTDNHQQAPRPRAAAQKSDNRIFRPLALGRLVAPKFARTGQKPVPNCPGLEGGVGPDKKSYRSDIGVEIDYTSGVDRTVTGNSCLALPSFA